MYIKNNTDCWKFFFLVTVSSYWAFWSVVMFQKKLTAGNPRLSCYEKSKYSALNKSSCVAALRCAQRPKKVLQPIQIPMLFFHNFKCDSLELPLHLHPIQDVSHHLKTELTWAFHIEAKHATNSPSIRMGPLSCGPVMTPGQDHDMSAVFSLPVLDTVHTMQLWLRFGNSFSWSGLSSHTPQSGLWGSTW